MGRLRTRAGAVAALALVFAAASFAEDKPPAKELAKGTGVIVTLAEGREAKGVYLGRHDGAVWVGVDGGEIGIEPGTIVNISPAETDDSEFLKRKAGLAPKDVPGRWGLAEWALKRGLVSSAKAEALIVVGLDPNHRKARRLLGHERIDGVWLERDDAMRAKGLVEYRGEWITKERISRIEAARIVEEDRIRRFQLMQRKNQPAAPERTAPARPEKSGYSESYISAPKGTIR